jgi:hypothetical protein
MAPSAEQKLNSGSKIIQIPRRICQIWSPMWVGNIIGDKGIQMKEIPNLVWLIRLVKSGTRAESTCFLYLLLLSVSITPCNTAKGQSQEQLLGCLHTFVNIERRRFGFLVSTHTILKFGWVSFTLKQGQRLEPGTIAVLSAHIRQHREAQIWILGKQTHNPEIWLSFLYSFHTMTTFQIPSPTWCHKTVAVQKRKQFTQPLQKNHSGELNNVQGNFHCSDCVLHLKCNMQHSW